MSYVATINVPGYLPEGEPAEFDTAAEAWAYLEGERECRESEVTNDSTFVASECLSELRRIAEAAQWAQPVSDGTGTVYGNTPGYDGTHDLGLAYCVSIAEGSDDDRRTFTEDDQGNWHEVTPSSARFVE